MRTAWSSCWLHRSPAPDVVPGYVVHVKTTAGGISEYVAADGISVLADDPPGDRRRCTTRGLQMVRGRLRAVVSKSCRFTG